MNKDKEDSPQLNKKPRFGSTNPNWKGGRNKSVAGYIRILKRGHPRAGRYGYIYEHIDVWEHTHDACLLSWADVDHINGIKDDNRPENLRAMMKGDHTRRHRIGYKHSEVTRKKIKETNKISACFRFNQGT